MAPLIRVSRAGFVYSCLGIASIVIGVKITLWAEQKAMTRVCFVSLCLQLISATWLKIVTVTSRAALTHSNMSID
jgi:hypothetical protein